MICGEGGESVEGKAWGGKSEKGREAANSLDYDVKYFHMPGEYN